jgi:hypothetical protein
MKRVNPAGEIVFTGEVFIPINKPFKTSKNFIFMHFKPIGGLLKRKNTYKSVEKVFTA